MSSMFSVSKLLGKSRGKSVRRDTASTPTRTSSLMSFAEKDKERKPSVPPVPPPPPAPIAVAIEQPPPQKADTPKAGPSDDVEPVSETEAPPLDVSDAIPVLPQAAVPEQAALVEEPEPIMLPLPLAEVVEDTTNTSLANLVPLQEPGYAVVSPPEARISMQVSETDWSALESESEGKDAKIAHAAVIQQDDAANQNEKVDLDTLPISNARVAEHKEDEEAIAGARMSALNEQLQEVQNALRLAKEELSSKSDALDDLRVENLKMSVEMEKMRTEKMEISNAAARQKHELQEEILRLKGIIEVERLDNRERIDNLDRENQVNLERIHLLEQRIEAQKEEAGDLYRRNHELELRLQRHEDDVADGRDLVAEKENHIKMVELNNENLASQLLRLQISLNGAKRQNRMLMDQLRQQANELQVSKMGASRLGAALFGSRGLSNAPTEVRTESAITVAKQLNEEIFQTAASLTDRLETISKRFVIEDEGAAAMAEMLKTMLGLELVKTLQKEASNTPEDFSPFIQIALQGCLIASCMHIITSWYPPEWDYASFLYALYERIRGTGGLAIALPWRKATQQICVPTSDRNTKLVAYLTEQVHALLTVCGWSKQSEIEDILREKYAKRMSDMVSLALQLNSLTTAGGNGELEAIMVDPGKAFNADRMTNDSPLRSVDGGKLIENRPPAEEVVCTVGLGLKRLDTAGSEAEEILLKPKVVLNGVLW